MVKLETGDTGVAVTADSDGALYSGMFGVDNYVVATGNKFKAEIQSNNKIKVNDGSAIMNGRHIRIPAGDSELMTINNGSQGMNRLDLIALRYKKELTGVESGNLVVIQGEESSGVPKVPDHVKGDILTGATQADFPLYEVKLEGINITEIKPLFQTIGNITELEKQIIELSSKTLGFIDISRIVHTSPDKNEYSQSKTIWTATENCWCSCYVRSYATGQYTGTVNLEGKIMGYNEWDKSIRALFPVKKGQTVSSTSGYVSGITFYGCL